MGETQDSNSNLPVIITAAERGSDFALSSHLPYEVVETVIAGVLSSHSRRAYMGDIRHFLQYLADHDTTLVEVTRPVLVSYRSYLARGFAPSTVNRRLTVARRLITEAWELGYLSNQSRNPADGRAVAGLKDSGDRGKPALTLPQARALLDSTRLSRDLPSLRDTALLHLLIGTGLRRSELASCTLAALQIVGGHTVLWVTGKGNKRRPVKLTTAVIEDLLAWLSVTGRCRHDVGATFRVMRPEAPVFSPIRKTGRGKEARWTALDRPLSDWGIWSIVRNRIRAAGLDVDTTPHGLRATFITLALEAGATISKVQDAAGHKDPRTTDRYRRRKANLDDNAADYVNL
jgi:site-specific recombinase XerD